MKKKYFALAAMASMVLNVAAYAAGDTKKARAKKRAVTRLVAMLPASDGVAAFESKRFFDRALPTVLSANQPVLSEITAKLNAMQDRTGIDLRKFDSVVVGIAFKQVSATEVDFEPVAIANGDVNGGALAAVGKLAKSGSYREENIAGKTVYVFSATDVIQKTSVTTTNSRIAAAIDRAFRGLSREIAVTAIDQKTLVLGGLDRVRETLEHKSRIAADLSGLLSVSETAVATFAAKPAGKMSKLLPLDVDLLGNNLDSIQYLSGSLDVAPIGTTLQVVARTRLPHQALALKDTLDVLQNMGGGLLGASKKPNQQTYARLIKGVRSNVRGSDLTIDVTVPQSDIDALVSGIK
jgi:hypothetical protein